MKYLVIGGAGFIGSNLSEYLIENGHELIICDNLHTGSIDNISNIINDVKYIEKNCGKLNSKDVEGIDGIFHMGIYSSSPMYKENYSLVGNVVNEFINVMTLASEIDAKIVWASTSSIYNGNPTPWKEDMPAYVMDYYGEARYYLERLAKLHYDWYGTRSVAMRFFSVYGPNERSKKQYANLVSQFLWDMKEGLSPILYGDGTQRRDFIFVKDIINGLELAMNSKIENDVFNLGTGKTTSLLELVDILNNKLSRDIKPEFVENTIKGYVPETQADTNKAKEVLNFESKISLENGIQYLIDMGEK